MTRLVGIEAAPVNLHAGQPEATQRFENSPPFQRACQRQRRENRLFG